jgi:alpha-tubulin suppressor-like RCC1 family protein
MADAALTALRAATCECAAAARHFNPDQSADAAALADHLRALFSKSTTAVATAELRVEQRTSLLPHLSTELIVEVLQHLDVRSLGLLACTCKQLYFDPPCPPRPASLVEAAIRRRADEVGRWTPSSLPAGVNKWVPFLLQREWRSRMEMGSVAAGRDRSFFVDASGTEEEGEVGLLGLQGGTTSQAVFTAAVPAPVPSMAGVRIRAVSCHDYFNLAVSEAGQVFAWGRQLPLKPEEDIALSVWHPTVPTVMEELRNHRVSQIIAGRFHCAALTEDGALFTWEIHRQVDTVTGEPAPELGYGRFFHTFGAPHRVLACEGTRIISVAVGAGFTVAVTEAGAVYSFGMGDGRLGHGDGDEDEGVYLPKRSQALNTIPVATVAAGARHALALTRCGRVYSWGADGPPNPVHGLGRDSDEAADDGVRHYGTITSLS